MPRGIEVDWVIVRVVTVRKLVAIGVTGVVAAAVVLFAYLRLHEPPNVRARRALESAEAVHEKAMAATVPEAWKGELQQAEAQLESARAAYAGNLFDQAIDHAQGARSRFEALLGAGSHVAVGVGQFFSLNGRVSVQRAGKPDWVDASQRMPVFNGDFVKTGRDGSAEILFADGSLYRVAPNSLLEIHHQGSADSSSTVKMIAGQINVHTSDSGSTVTTESSETLIQRDSRVAVDVPEGSRQTTVAALAGSARVRNAAGQVVTVGSREQVATQADGRFTEKRHLPNPPLPLEPLNNAGFELHGNPVINLRWRKAAEGQTVHLQVSRSPHFLDGQVDVDAATLSRDSARLKAVAAGTYYWRLATVAGASLRSEWSQVRRFQVYRSRSQQLPEDRTPPTLELKAVQHGQVFIIEGQTEVGATITINGEEVGVDRDGRFRKTMEATQVGVNDVAVVATDPAGNRTEQIKKVFVEGF